MPLIGRDRDQRSSRKRTRVCFAFEQDRQDLSATVPPELRSQRARPGQQAQAAVRCSGGIRLEARRRSPITVYVAFNMEDPVVGGYDNDRIALRRAIGDGLRREEDARVDPATTRRGARRSSFRPTSAATIPRSRSTSATRRRGARARLLDKFGYVDRDSDGLARAAPDRPSRWYLALVRRRRAGSARQHDELLAAQSSTALGIARRIRQAEMAGPAEGGSPRAAADVAGGKHQRHVRRLHVPLRCCTA